MLNKCSIFTFASVFYSLFLFILPSLAQEKTQYQGIDCISNLKYLQEHYFPQSTLEELAGLVLERKGSGPESYMTALGLHRLVKGNRLYKVTDKGLKEVGIGGTSGVINLESLPRKLPPPPFVEIQAKWDKTISSIAGEANILGGNGRLIFNSSEIEIPAVEATNENLAYYGAKTVKMGDVVKFSDPSFPIWMMRLGKDYVRDYIMVKGGGLYVEYHNDRPHFHMPLSEDAGGYYLLGKKVGEDRFRLTAFRIPYGKAVYTCKGVIHCDAALTGAKWIVGYTNALDFSTVLMRDSSDQPIRVHFKDQLKN